mmetsp:Transcript_89322/g.193335  ORF Transcript_89322/g.193335 Transcript_89322/m.193335 type:complete len:212 (-) Transcript_89322:311-946(-)
MPIVGALLETKGLADIHKVEDVLLEARAAVSDRGLQELVSDAHIRADGARDLVNVSVRLVAQSSDGIDGRDTLGQEGVRDQLGELGGPQVGGDDALRLDPVRVNRHEGGDGSQAFGGLVAADEHSGREQQVLHGGALGQKLGVTQHLELVGRGAGKHSLDRLGRSDGDSGLLNHNLISLGHLSDLSGAELAVLDVGCAAGSNTRGLGGGVD